jgi:hypothetical protein
LASLDAAPGVHRQAAVTTTSSLHAVTVGLLHVFVEALNVEEENKQLMIFDPKKRENIRMLTCTGLTRVTTCRATCAL